jgi:AcrR family transcriptional regulator
MKPVKPAASSATTRRTPSQERAQQKVALILEAAMQLLDKGSLESLTTNAIAERAGVSIGTLYQYFGSKQAVLDALADREMAALTERVLGVMHGAPGLPPGERLRMVLAAAMKTYGGRTRVYRLVLAYALAQGGPSRLAPLMATLMSELAREERPHAPATRKLAPAEAFVLAHAVSGVLRAMLLGGGSSATRQEIEDALVALVGGYVARGTGDGTATPTPRRRRG